MVSWQIPITQQTSADPGSIPGWRKFRFVFAALFSLFFYLFSKDERSFFQVVVSGVQEIELSRAR